MMFNQRPKVLPTYVKRHHMINKTIKGFKFIKEDMKSANGDHTWKLGVWYKYQGELELCKSGFHACLIPQQSFTYMYGERWFEVEARGKIIYEKDDKFVAEEMRLVREILPGKGTKLLKKYRKDPDFKEVENKLKNIPTKKDVINLLKGIHKIRWFTPQKPRDSEIKRKVREIIRAFNLDFGFDVKYHPLDKQSDWEAARDSSWASSWNDAWHHAWNDAWISVRHACYTSAISSGRDSGLEVARDSGWGAARDSSWACAIDSALVFAIASARDSARDSAMTCEFEVVKDLMEKKGYDTNPFKTILNLWKMGIYPVGILKDEKFHIYYVPLTKDKSIQYV